MDSLLVAIFILVLVIYSAIMIGFGLVFRDKYERIMKWLESLRDGKKE